MNNTFINVLIVEDDTDYAQLIQQQLAMRFATLNTESYCSMHVDSLKEAKQYIHTNHSDTGNSNISHPNDRGIRDKYEVDIILLDLALPDSNGLASLKSILESAPDSAVIVLTGTGNSQDSLEALRIGAQDYLIKGEFDAQLLHRSIRYALERKKAELSLHASHRRYRALIEHNRDIVMIIDAELAFIYGSPALESTLGYDEIAQRTYSFLDLVHPGDSSYLQKLCDEALLHPGVTQSMRDCRFRNQLGIWHTMTGTITNLLHDPALRGLVINISDVTIERQLESVAVHSQRLESIGVMSSAIAHDINNYLAAIMGQGAIARRKLSEDSPIDPYMERVIKSAKEAASITRQLMTYASEGGAPREVISLHQLITDHALIGVIPQMIDIALNIELADDPLLIEADPVQLRQVIMNLVLNAAEAIQPAAGKISIAARQKWLQQGELAHYLLGATLSSGNYIILEVRDSGNGMNEDTLTKIFDPFFSTKQAGTGLGLFSTLGIVRSHKGAIHVASAPGKGSVFYILLPASDVVHNNCAPATVLDVESL